MSVYTDDVRIIIFYHAKIKKSRSEVNFVFSVKQEWIRLLFYFALVLHMPAFNPKIAHYL